MTGGPRWSFVRSEARRRPWAYVGLAVVVALGAGACLGALALADRTDHAYAAHVESAHVNELAVNPSLATTAIDDAIRHFDGVTSVHTDDYLAVVTDLQGGKLGDLASDDQRNNLQVEHPRTGATPKCPADRHHREMPP